MTQPDARPKRLCETCLKLDDYPRHILATAAGESGVLTAEQLDSLPANTPPAAVAQAMDPTTTIRHIECCADQGCALCRETLDAAGDARGAKLLGAIQRGVADKLGSPKEA